METAISHPGTPSILPGSELPFAARPPSTSSASASSASTSWTTTSSPAAAGYLGRGSLVSGLVPLAVLVLAASVYPRLRAGFRAIIALTAGFLALVGGAAEAGYYTVKVGASGDDYTGLLMIAAGALLIAVGVWTLWCTRRLDESRRRRYPRRFLMGVLGFVVFFEIVLSIAFSYVYARGAAGRARGRPGTPYEEVTFTTSDGLELAGWYIPSRNGAAVIAFPAARAHSRTRGCSPRLRRSPLRPSRRRRERRRPQHARLGRRPRPGGCPRLLQRRLRRRSRPHRRPRALGRRRDAPQSAAESNALKAVVSEGAGTRSIREHVHMSGAAKWILLPQWSVITAATAVFSNHAPPPDLNKLVDRIAPRPSSSSTPRTDRAPRP